MYMDEKEIITIVQKSTNDYLQLQCQIAVSSSGDTRENRKKEGGLSAGAIITFLHSTTKLTVFMKKEKILKFSMK